MAETSLAKKRLSINLSFLNLAKLTSTQKSPKTFNDPNGVVGLQIVAALNQDHHQDSIFINGFSSGLVPISPKFSSSPIPILTNNRPFDKNLTIEEMELCEEYTCVISHVGDRLIKKREYFEADLLGNINNEGCERIFVVSDNTVSCGDGGGGGGDGGFLNTCFLCDEMLDGLDIFMYRGEKAFCSVECRHKHIAIDQSKEKRCRSGKRKPMECSVSPCSSSPMQFCAGVAAA